MKTKLLIAMLVLATTSANASPFRYSIRYYLNAFYWASVLNNPYPGLVVIPNTTNAPRTPPVFYVPGRG